VIVLQRQDSLKILLLLACRRPLCLLLPVLHVRCMHRYEGAASVMQALRSTRIVPQTLAAHYSWMLHLGGLLYANMAMLLLAAQLSSLHDTTSHDILIRGRCDHSSYYTACSCHERLYYKHSI
jgi:hypothetical protein